MELAQIQTMALKQMGYSTEDIADTIPDRPEFSGTVSWDINDGGFWDGIFLEEGDTFIIDRIYRARIRLTAKNGYTFQGTEANSFSYPKAAVTNPVGTDNTLTITVRFFDTPGANDRTVYFNDLARALPAPVRGVTPETTFGFSQYSGNVDWQTSAGNPFSGEFQAGTAYRAIVSLTPVFGFTFSGLDNGNGLIHSTAQSSSFDLINGTIDIVFNATAGASQDSTINLYNLSGVLTRPMYNTNPLMPAINTSQYTGTVAWFYEDNSSVTGRLEKDKPFKAVITLQAQSGFTFTGVPVNAFFHDDMIWAENTQGTGNTMTITVAFRGASDQIRFLTAADGIIIKGCCWTRHESPGHLIDGDNGTRWVYAWGNNSGTAQMNHTDWPELRNNDNMVTSVMGIGGHAVMLDEELGLKPAHFITFDLRRTRNIAAIRARPSGTGSNPQNFFGEWEVFVSGSDIGINPSGAAAWKSGELVYDGVRWYTMDMFNDDLYATTRFLQFRVYSCANPDVTNLIVEAGRLEVGIYD